jgi:hypothetical protein
MYSSLSSFPKLAHRIRLPDVLEVYNCPMMKSYPCLSTQVSPTMKVYRRVQSQHKAEHELLRAKLYFASGGFWSPIGHGNSGEVFRVRLEHPDMTSEIKVSDKDRRVCEQNGYACTHIDHSSDRIRSWIWVAAIPSNYTARSSTVL